MKWQPNLHLSNIFIFWSIKLCVNLKYSHHLPVASWKSHLQHNQALNKHTFVQVWFTTLKTWQNTYHTGTCQMLQILNKITLHYACNYVLLTKNKVKMAGHWTQCQSIAGLHPAVQNVNYWYPFIHWAGKERWSEAITFVLENIIMAEIKLRSDPWRLDWQIWWILMLFCERLNPGVISKGWIWSSGWT